MRFKSSKRSQASRLASGKTTRKIATNTAIEVKNLKKVFHPEVYEYDTSNTDQLASFTAVVTPISNMAQGDDNGNRSGLYIYAKSLRVSHDWIVNNTNAEPQKVRVMVICDTENQGTTPTSANIFGALSGTENILNAPVVASDLQRFKVLYDKLQWLGSASNQAAQGRRLNIKVNRKIYYTGAANTALSKGNLYLVFMSSNSAVNQPSFNYHTRLSYLDN